MGIICYWTNYIKNTKMERSLSGKFLLNLVENEFSSKFFFNKRKELISFIKYVVLPSFIYIKTDIEPLDEIVIKVQDYKDVLNFFVNNNIPSSNELIRRYSFFYNSLEEFEYEDIEVGEKSFNEFIERFNNYFKSDEYKMCEIKIDFF